MLIEIRIIADDSGEALRDLAHMARRYGLDVESVEIDRDPGNTIIVTATARLLGRAKRGRRRGRS